MDHLQSILKKLPVKEQDQLTQLITNQQKTIALHRELIKQLNQAMALNKAVLNAAGEGIIAVDENHKIIDFNPALADMFGFTERELKGQNLDLLLPQKMQNVHHETMCRFGDRPQPRILGNQAGSRLFGAHKTKGPFRVSVAISHGLRNGEKIYTAIVRDLTHQNRLERENQRQAQKLVNRAKELEGLYSLAKLHQEDSVPAIFRKLFEDIAPKTTKYPDKAVIIAELDGHTYRSSDESPVVSLSSKLHNGRLTFGFTENIPYGTRQHQKLLDTFTAEFDQVILHVKAAQRELQVERKAAAGELSSGVAHTVNNGLQIIQGYAQVALGLAESEGINEPLEKIRQKARELGANIHGLLRPTNQSQDKSQFEVFELGELLDDYLAGAENPLKSEALRQGATVAINKNIGIDTCVNADKEDITLIAQALIKNSIDSLLEDGSVMIDVIRKGEYVHLRVKDTGAGMDEKTQQKLFEPYSKTNGTELHDGLSLNAAQRMAHKHGGRISLVKSQAGHGTTMELRLPYAHLQEQEQKQAQGQEREIRTRKHLNILWAEDDIIVQETVKMMTKDFGDQIDFVENGKIALDMLRQKSYDVLITDVGMPVMGGWQLLKNIEGRYENMPRVLASGYVINSSDMRSSGASYLLNKPLEMDELVKVLENIKTRPRNPKQSAVEHSAYSH